MPIGAGGEALRRIEAALADDDPELVASFRTWREPPGTDAGDGGSATFGVWTGLVPLLGLAALAAGPVTTIVLGLLVAAVVWVVLRARRADYR